MSVVYERSGGIAGNRQRLELLDEALTWEDRFHGKGERKLTLAEHARVAALVERARDTAPPTVRGGRAQPDSFQLQISLDGFPRAIMTTTDQPVPSDGSQWGDLFAFLDALLASEVDKAGSR